MCQSVQCAPGSDLCSSLAALCGCKTIGKLKGKKINKNLHIWLDYSRHSTETQGNGREEVQVIIRKLVQMNVAENRPNVRSIKFRIFPGHELGIAGLHSEPLKKRLPVIGSPIWCCRSRSRVTSMM